MSLENGFNLWGKLYVAKIGALSKRISILDSKERMLLS